MCGAHLSPGAPPPPVVTAAEFAVTYGCPAFFSAEAADLAIACCPGATGVGWCGGGAPAQCSPACARIYLAVYRVCSDYIDSALPKLALFDQQCVGKARPPPPPPTFNGTDFFAHPAGNDSLPGTDFDHPLKTLHACVGKLRCVRTHWRCYL